MARKSEINHREQQLMLVLNNYALFGRETHLAEHVLQFIKLVLNQVRSENIN